MYNNTTLTCHRTGPHASGLTIRPCDATKAAQRFRVPASGTTGQIRDKSTGRCVSVLECALPSKQPQLADAEMGVAMLDRCGGSCAASSQRWEQNPVGNEHIELISKLRPGSSDQQWRIAGTFNPESVNGESIVVQLTPNSAAPNTHYKRLEKGSGLRNTWKQLQLGEADSYGASCPQGNNCCLEALPCTHPCSLPLSWGWVVVAIFVAAVFLCA